MTKAKVFKAFFCIKIRVKMGEMNKENISRRDFLASAMGFILGGTGFASLPTKAAEQGRSLESMDLGSMNGNTVNVRVVAKYRNKFGKTGTLDYVLPVQQFGRYGFITAHNLGIESYKEGNDSLIGSSKDIEEARRFRKTGNAVLSVVGMDQKVEALHTDVKNDMAILKFSKGNDAPVYDGTKALIRKGTPVNWIGPDGDKKSRIHQSEIVSDREVSKEELGYADVEPYLARGYLFKGTVVEGNSGQIASTLVGNQRIPLLVISDSYTNPRDCRYAGNSQGTPIARYIEMLKKVDPAWSRNIRVLPLPK